MLVTGVEQRRWLLMFLLLRVFYQVITESDAALHSVQDNLKTLKTRYLTTKSAYEAALAEIADTQKDLELLIQARDIGYRTFVVDSLFACNPEATPNVVSGSSAGMLKHAEIQSLATKEATPTGASVPSGSADTTVRTPRLRRDSFQEVQHAASAVATKASESVSAATTAATETASAYGGWMSSKFAAASSKVRASFTGGRRSADSSPEPVAAEVVAPSADAEAVKVAEDEAKDVAESAAVAETEVESKVDTDDVQDV